MRLEDLKPSCVVRGVLPDSPVTVVSVQWHGSDALTLVFRKGDGSVGSQLLYRSDEARLEPIENGRPWSFDGDGALFRLVSEAQRIRLAHLYDPLLAVHTSDVEPLPHQITAVYQEMLPRQPLRFLLADDPGAGKTIMAGLLIRELIARSDVKRCLIVCPGSLGEQWQDELFQRFHMPFEILTRDKFEAAHTRNWFLEHDLVIARLDQLARNEDFQKRLQDPDAAWDLVVFDEAHKLSATFFGSEIKYTKRYRLAQLVARRTRHLLLMTATPHNGKEEDFQLFLALLDGDRFEGRFRDGVHAADVSDLMRRMVKERLLTFDGKPLFPERRAHTVPYKLSSDEAGLYEAVTEYVRTEFNRADNLDKKRRGAVGFALTMIQRRLASSPEAIYRSLTRRRERLEERVGEIESGKRPLRLLEFDDEMADALEEEEDAGREYVDHATAARSISELKEEIATLKRLGALARRVRQAGRDTKWRELSKLLDDMSAGTRRKLVLFTEYVDTLRYLKERISTRIGREGAVGVIHGGVKREDRLKIQEAFKHDPDTQILLATDAAGEGINLQNAHLMVNYDLPWNPNRLEQRFGRIHRIGQTEVCHLWNLVAEDTREGDVYQRLLEKLDQARETLGGQVFDVLGKLEFKGKPLRDLLLEAIRYGNQPKVRARLNTVVDNTLDRQALRDLMEERQLVLDAMDTTRLRRVREEMERAEARRLQPHFIRSFFGEAFRRSGGQARERERGRFEVTHVPQYVRSFAGTEPVLRRYERIAFEKDLIAVPGKPRAAFLRPGHPLLEAVTEVTLGLHRDLLRRGAILVDERDPGKTPRVLVSVEHALEDGASRVISKRILYVEIDANGAKRYAIHAPYLDYRPLEPDEPKAADLLARTVCSWIGAGVELEAVGWAIAHAIPDHLGEVKKGRLELIDRTRVAVKERLVKEINHWDMRAAKLAADEREGKAAARLNASEARRRAEALHIRMKERLKELDDEAHIVPRPPVVTGAVLVAPLGMVRDLSPAQIDTMKVAKEARDIVMAAERKLGFEPVDREYEKVGYDVESRDPKTGQLRFIEVKGRRADADTITVTKNEILTSLNAPDKFILAIVRLFGDGRHELGYVREPFQSEPEFSVASVNYSMKALWERAEPPR